MRPSPLFAAALALLTSACIIIDDGDDDGDTGAADGGGTGAGDGTGSGACFESPECDPLAPDCPDLDKCVPDASSFVCVTTMVGAEELGEGDPCESSLSCQPGLICIPGIVGCEGAGCCVALCDVAQPQCPGNATCTPFYESGQPPPCYEDVGVCLGG